MYCFKFDNILKAHANNLTRFECEGDLRSMNLDNQNFAFDPSRKKPLMTTIYEPSPLETKGTARSEGDTTHARGGHGIFGTPIVSIFSHCNTVRKIC